jgi:hypothetical protein
VFDITNLIINIAIESTLAIVGNRKDDRPIPVTRYEIADNGTGIPKKNWNQFLTNSFKAVKHQQEQVILD